MIPKEFIFIFSRLYYTTKLYLCICIFARCLVRMCVGTRSYLPRRYFETSRWRGPCYIPDQDIVIPPPPAIVLDDSPLLGSPPTPPYNGTRPVRFFFGGFIPPPEPRPPKGMRGGRGGGLTAPRMHRLARVRQLVSVVIFLFQGF
jgi:hypothetical protein